MAGCDPPRLVQGLVGQMVGRWRGCWGVARLMGNCAVEAERATDWGVALFMGGWLDLSTW